MSDLSEVMIEVLESKLREMKELYKTQKIEQALIVERMDKLERQLSELETQVKFRR
jgi:hypothetical protein